MGRDNPSLNPENSLPPAQARDRFIPPEPPVRDTAGDALRRDGLLSLGAPPRDFTPPEATSLGTRGNAQSILLADLNLTDSRGRAVLPDLIIVRPESTREQTLNADKGREVFGNNVVLDDNHQIAKITYPAEGKTREFGRDENGEINKVVTTNPHGQFSYVKEDGNWLYLAPDHKKYSAPDLMVDDNGEFSKVVRDGVVLTQRPDGRSFEEERTAVGARIQRDSDGNPLTIKRPDHTMVNATYEDGKLVKLVDNQDGQSVTWKPDAKGVWHSDNVPSQTVRNMKVEENGNLSYTVDKVKYTIRGNGAEIKEGPGLSRYSFDEQGRISSIKYPSGKSALSFGYLGSDDNPTFVQVNDLEKHQSKKYICQPEKGGWTELDRNNNLLGTWKGSVSLNDDGSYAIKSAGDTWLTYLPDGKTYKEKSVDLESGAGPRGPAQGGAERATPERRNPDQGNPNQGNSEHRNLSRLNPEQPNPEQRNPAQRSSENRDPDQRERTEPARKPESEKPRTADPNSLNEVTDHSVQLKGYMLPSPDQLGAGSCLYMSATGIAEYLINKSKGIANPQVGGPTDLSEQWTLNLSKTVQLGNNYTDAPELIARGGGLTDSRMKFKSYATSSWMNEPAIPGRGTEAVPPFKKDVLYNGGGEGSQNHYGQMRPADLDRIKKYLRESQSPVLFVYKPPTANWWHANIITGYNDKTQSFTVRDSSFGQPAANVPKYNYAGGNQYGPKSYRNETQMPYYQALQWGNHATGYKLAGS